MNDKSPAKKSMAKRQKFFEGTPKSKDFPRHFGCFWLYMLRRNLVESHANFKAILRNFWISNCCSNFQTETILYLASVLATLDFLLKLQKWMQNMCKIRGRRYKPSVPKLHESFLRVQGTEIFAEHALNYNACFDIRYLLCQSKESPEESISNFIGLLPVLCQPPLQPSTSVEMNPMS